MPPPRPDEILELARARIAERRAQAQSAAAGRRDRFWELTFLALIGTIALTFVLWPGATLEWKLYAAVHGLVAQKHLVFLGERPLPLCARNAGIYSSYLLSLGYLFARGYGRAAALPARPLLAVLGLGALTMIGDGINSVLEDTGRAYFYLPRNDLRTITGVLFGIALTPIILFVFNRALRADAEMERPVLDWRGYGALLLLNGLLVMAIYSGLDALYWPLALLGVAGIIAELFTMFLLLAAVGSGYTRRITALRQLARPACIALVPTLLVVAGLAMLRFAGGG
ncbi:MAG: DUF2085 domain-containing protein [Chloroflexaceae bacterium]